MSETTELAIPQQSQQNGIAAAMVASRLFGDVKNIAQAAVKLKLGRDLNIDSFAAMSQIFFVNGKPAMTAGLQARLIKASGKYRYEVREKTNKKCVIEFFELVEEYEQGKKSKRWKSIGVEEFNEEDAKLAKLTTGSNAKNWSAYPKAMLFARCLTHGFRTHCPDAGAAAGGTIYLPDEINNNVTVDYSSADGVVVAVDGEPPKESQTRRELFAALVAETGTDVTKLLEFYKRGSVDDMTDDDIRHATDILEKKKAAK